MNLSKNGRKNGIGFRTGKWKLGGDVVYILLLYAGEKRDSTELE